MAFKLKDGSGVEHTYDKKKLKIPSTTEGETVVFTEGEAQAEKTVDISTNGAFEVEPDAGYAFVKKVSGTVAVPAPVTSVNGKTGDVKTRMVVNFTVTNGQPSPDVPFADVLAFIQGFTNCLPSITVNTIDANDVFNNYTFNQYQVVSSAGGESQIIFFDGKSLKNTLVGAPGMLIWNTNKATLFSYSTATSILLLCEEVSGAWEVSPFIPTDESAFAVFDGGLMELMSTAVTTGDYPTMLVFVGEDITPAYFSGLFGESVVFRSRELDGTVKVITGTAGTSGISWVVTEEPSSVLIVDYNPDNATANKSFDEIHNAATNDIPVFLHFENRLIPLTINNGVSDSSITFELVSIDKTGYTSLSLTVTPNNTWSVGVTSHKFQYKSPGGKYFEVEVSDDGTLSTVEVTT